MLDGVAGLVECLFKDALRFGGGVGSVADLVNGLDESVANTQYYYINSFLSTNSNR